MTLSRVRGQKTYIILSAIEHSFFNNNAMQLNSMTLSNSENKILNYKKIGRSLFLELFLQFSPTLLR